jgi:hypothetical protein
MKSSPCLPNEVERRKFPRGLKNVPLRGETLWNFSSRQDTAATGVQ